MKYISIDSVCEGFQRECYRNVIADAKMMGMFGDVFPDGHFDDLRNKPLEYLEDIILTLRGPNTVRVKDIQRIFRLIRAPSSR